MVSLDDLSGFKTQTAAELRMTAGDKRKLIDDITEALGIGGWSCPGRDGRSTWDVTDEDIDREWAELEAAALKEHEDPAIAPAFTVALLLATEWERHCLIGDPS